MTVDADSASRQLAPGRGFLPPQARLMPCFLATTCLHTKVSVGHGPGVTVRDENESLRLPHPCALVAPRHLLNTTWSLKLLSKDAWDTQNEKYIALVACDWRGSSRDGSRTGTDRRGACTDAEVDLCPRKSAVRHLHHGQLARP